MFTSRQFSRVVEVSGDFFPDVVDTILPFLGPASRLLRIRYLLGSGNGKERIEIAAKYPIHTLELLHAFVPDDPRDAPYELGRVLKLVVDSAPELRQDHRWVRLHQIALGV